MPSCSCQDREPSPVFQAGPVAARIQSIRIDDNPFIINDRQPCGSAFCGLDIGGEGIGCPSSDLALLGHLPPGGEGLKMAGIALGHSRRGLVVSDFAQDREPSPVFSRRRTVPCLFDF